MPLCQSLKSPLADIVALSDESLHSLINDSSTSSSSSGDVARQFKMNVIHV